MLRVDRLIMPISIFIKSKKCMMHRSWSKQISDDEVLFIEQSHQGNQYLIRSSQTYLVRPLISIYQVLISSTLQDS